MRADFVDHGLVIEFFQTAEAAQVREINAGHAVRFERGEIAAGTLDVNHFDLVAEDRPTELFDRDVAPAMQDKMGILTDQSRGVEA